MNYCFSYKSQCDLIRMNISDFRKLDFGIDDPIYVIDLIFGEVESPFERRAYHGTSL